MTINVSAEREAVAKLLYRWHCEAEPDWDEEWDERYWDDLQIESEREEWRYRAMALMDAIVGTLVETDREAVLRAELAHKIMEIPLSGFIGPGVNEIPDMSAFSMRFVAAATVDMKTAKSMRAAEGS